MSAFEWFTQSAIVDALGWTLVHSLWEGFAVAVVLAIVLWAMRRASAAVRYIVAVCALGMIVVAAGITFGLLNRQAARRDAIHDEPLPALVLDGTVHSLRHVSSAPMHIPEPTLSERLEPMLPWLVLLWAVGVVVLGIYQFGGWVVVRRLCRSGETIGDVSVVAIFRELIDRIGASRATRIVQSALVQVPSAVGWLRPVVLLPASAISGLSPDQLRGLLAHELAHVRRYDYLANLIQCAIETVLFYHPAIWWIGSRIRQERENACDDLAAEVCDRATYARALAAMETLRQAPALALSARGAALLPRIRRLLGVSAAPGRRSIWSGSIAIGLLLVLAAPLAIVHLACQSNNASAATQPASQSSPMILEGHITDSAGKPVAGVAVKIYSGLATRFLSGTTTTDSSGYYRFENPTGALIKATHAATWNTMLFMQIEHDKLCSADGNSWWDVTIPGEKRQLTKDFSLVPGGKFSGTVNDSTGRGRAKLDLRVYAEGNKFSAYTTTDDRGQFTTQPLFPGSYTIDVNSSDPWYPKLATAEVRAGEISPLALKYDGKTPTAAPSTKPAADQMSDFRAVSPADLESKTEDYKIGPNDLLSISMSDLTGANSETVKQCRVSAKGQVSLPIVGAVTVAGKTDAELEFEIAKIYENRGLVRNMQVGVTIVEARGQTFSILGAVGSPGEYAIAKNDFRMLDALALARDATAAVREIYIIRKAGGDTQKIRVNLDALKQGDMTQNIVIHAGDVIIVRAPESVAPPVTDSTRPYHEQRLLALQTQRDDLKQSLEERSQIYQAGSPTVVALKQKIDNIDKQIVELSATLDKPTSAPPSTQPGDRGVYYISGVPKSGVYTLPAGGMNARTALISAGFNENANTKSFVLIRRSDDHETRIDLDPMMKAAGEAPKLMANDVIIVSDSPLARGEYYIGGHVPRVGVYSLSGRKITLLQALIAAGADPVKLKGEEILVTRRMNGAADESFHFLVTDVLNSKSEPFALAADDVVQVQNAGPATKPDNPADNTAANFVRLVVGKDAMSFEGKPVTMEQLKAAIAGLPDPPNTALEICVASEEMTIHEKNDAVSLATALQKQFGFKYVTETGIKLLGTKAGDGAPATQPATQPAAVRTIHVVVGMDSLTLDGKAVSRDDLEDALAALPDRAHAVLEAAIATEDVPFGQLGRVMETGSRLGFREVVNKGVQPLTPAQNK